MLIPPILARMTACQAECAAAHKPLVSGGNQASENRPSHTMVLGPGAEVLDSAKLSVG